jgi:hypothetical protein
MQMKLVKYGADQDAVVNQSISNQWQGLFDLQRAKPAPGEKPVKSAEQIAAENQRYEGYNKQSAWHWDKFVVPTPLGKLKLADALHGRYMVRQDEPQHEERIEWLRDQVGLLVRDADAKAVWGDPSLRGLVRSLFGEKGAERLRARASA